MLYLLPDEDLSKGAADLELCQRLEGALIHWTRQIKQVLSLADGAGTGDQKDTGGPLEELAFYASRCNDLSGVAVQLKSERVTEIVGVLEAFGSAYLAPFQALAKAIVRGFDEASENLKLLGVLKPPCDALTAAKPTDVPALLPEIMARIRVISAVSPFYCTPERVTRLLRRVTNEVLRRCASSIAVHEVFSGDPELALQSLNECSACFSSWRAAFDNTVEAVAASKAASTPRARVWFSLDAAAIFAPVDAFSQRCADLVSLCEAQVQFARKTVKGSGEQAPLPPMGGLRGNDIARSLCAVEATFLQHVASLQALEAVALDVKAGAWGETNAAVRAGVKDLENMYSGIISEAFANVTAVGPAVAMLEAFASVAKSPTVVDALEKRAVEVFAMFGRTVGELQAAFEAAAPAPPLPPSAPRFSGSALWARGLQARCESDWKLLQSALVFLPPIKAAAEVGDSWERLRRGLEEYQRNKFTEWMTGLNDMDAALVGMRLTVPLFAQTANVDAGALEAAMAAHTTGASSATIAFTGTPGSKAGFFLRPNFDRRLLFMLGEAEGWDAFGGRFGVPTFAADLVRGEKGEALRQLRAAAQTTASDFNALVASLDDVETKLFSDTLRRLERKFSPGLAGGKITWSSKNVKENFLLDVSRAVSEVWATVRAFKGERARLVELLDALRATSLLHLEKNYVHDEGVFEERQRKHRAFASAALADIHRQIVALLAKCYAIFRGDGVAVQRTWAAWVLSVDARVEAALRALVFSSLQELNRAVGAGSGGGGGGLSGRGGPGASGALGVSVSGVSGSATGSQAVVGGGGKGGGGGGGVGGEEVQPLFRICIVMDTSVTPPVAQKPSVEAIVGTLKTAAQDLVTCVKVVPRLEDVLPVEIKTYHATEKGIKALRAKAAVASLGNQQKKSEEEEKKAEGKDGGMEAAGGAPDAGVGGKDKAPVAKLSFFAAVEGAHAVRDAVESIAIGAAAARKEVEKHTATAFMPFLQRSADFSTSGENQMVPLTDDRGKAIARFAKGAPTLTEFKNRLDGYVKHEQEVGEDILPSQQFGFLLLDHSVIKGELVVLSQEWRKSFTRLLNDNTKREVDGLHARFADATAALVGQPPEKWTLEELRTAIRHLSDFAKERGAIEARFEPLEAAYSMLATYDAAAEDAEIARLHSLRPTWSDFQGLLSAGEDSVKKAKVLLKKDTLDNLASFSRSITELKGVSMDPIDGLPYNYELLTADSAKSRLHEAKDRMGAWKERLGALNGRGRALEPAVEVFDLEVIDMNSVVEVEKDMEGLDTMWGLVGSWEKDWEAWKTGTFSSLDVTGMEDAAGKYRAKLIKLREFKKWGVWGGLEGKIKDFLATMPLIQALGNPAMRDRHWAAVKKEVAVEFDPASPDFTLEKVFEFGFAKHGDFIQDTSNAANKELAIENSLAEIAAAWAGLDLDLVEYKQVYYKVRSTEDLFQTLEDQAVAVSAMKASPFYGVFAAELDTWEKNLSVVSEVVDMLLQVQRQWMYLESIFMASEDIRKMLPVEAALFDDVNEMYMTIITRCVRIKKALPACTEAGFLGELEEMDGKLQVIQKALDAYLENKRQFFPRFYFLSNDDLLEILGQSKDPLQVQKHIKKCFEGIQTLVMVDPGTEGNRTYLAKGMNAPDGEKVPFERNVIVDGAVENWLTEVEKAMILGLAKVVTGCVKDAKKNQASPEKLSWIKAYPGQLLITAGMIWFVTNCQAALNNRDAPLKAMRGVRKRQVLLLNKLADIVREKLDKVSRKKVVALITMEIHARDVMERMIKAQCDSVEDFEWLSQLRLEQTPVKTGSMPYGGVVAKQTKSTLEFGFEYQGNNGRLVVTPLTDRCVLTLTTALYMQRGGAPAGPAGTGKTETVKDLGKNLAKFVVVFNCSDGLDFKSVGRMFSGLVQSGGWGCFDEFNRIEVEVLSVVAQQVLSIMEAIRGRKTEFVFMDRTIHCNWQCGIFITMNPGYAGRSELPDNLKSLFRPVAMMVPDLALIAEVMLQSEGFQNARTLAKKTVTLYSLMIQQLSKQDHYDYSLRSLRGVLVCAGSIKRSGADYAEDFIVLRAIRDMNLPKFIKTDAELFRLLLGDLFPSLELPPFEPGELGRAVEAELTKAGLQLNPTILQKCIELRDSKATRHCNMLVGRTQAGKTTTWKMLAAASTALATEKVEGYLKVRVESINPKSITMNELYGAYDLSTMEWMDGVLSSVFRGFARDERNEEKWLMLDGPVDTLWIESMNTVMDDNKTLTLINGDRIGMSETMSLLFECQDLAVASPATVSRAGMVYVDEADLGWGPYVTSWLARVHKASASERELLDGLFKKYCPRLLRFKRRECKELVPMGDFHAVASLCNLLDVLWGAQENGLGAHRAAGQDDKAYAAMAERWFAFAVVWSIGGAVDEAGRKRFNEALREVEPVFPPGGSVYDFAVDTVTKEIKPWADRLSTTWRPPRDVPFSKLIVPTIDTVRNMYVMTALVQRGFHFLAVGNTGTGKTALAQGLLEALPPETYAKLVMYFSAATTSSTVQEIIEGNLEKRSKNKMGPPGGRKMALLVDDLNMPKKDTFGSQPPLELLRQWLDYGGWYDRGKQAWRFIADLQLVSAMGPPGGGRTQISERLQSRFSIVNFTFPGEKDLKKIFETILTFRFAEFGEDVKRLLPGVVAATINVYDKVVESFLPTPSCSHYLFNLRDIANVIKGLLALNSRDTDSKEAFLLAWTHECMRTFADRFTNMGDVVKFRAIMDAAMHKGCDTYLKNLWEAQENPEAGPVFADFVGTAPCCVPAGGGEEQPPFKLQSAIDTLKHSVEEDMIEYNSTPGYLPMNLVFFRDALRHLARIHRVLRTPRGNALLVGVGGSGRQSLTRVAAFLTKDAQGVRMGTFSIEITKLYRMVEFHEDLKKLYNRTGVEGKPTCFLFSDTQIKEEGFLEDINNILNSGEVPNLFIKDERAAIVDSMRPIAKKAGLVMPGGGTFDEMWALFIERVRANLHVVLAMSPVGDNFRNRCRMYPSLVNCTTIDWFLEWPADALREVATKFLDDVALSPVRAPAPPPEGAKVPPAGGAAPPAADPDAALKGRVATVFASLHQSVIQTSARMLLAVRRYNYVTPTNYLELVLGYRELMRLKLAALGDARDKLANGLSKLESSKIQVEEMSVSLAEKQKVVEKSSAECDALLVKIVQEKRIADEQKAEVEETSARIAVEKNKCEAIAADANADLAEALPALEAAMAAVDKLDKASITEVKSFASPPLAVGVCLQAVCTLFNRPPSWDEAKRKMNESDFIQQIKGFDKDNVPQALIKKLRKYTELRAGIPNADQKVTFTVPFITGVSQAAGALAAWVLAIEKYSEVARTVEPKRAVLKSAESSLAEKQKALDSAMAILAAVVAKVEALNAQHLASVAEKNRLTAEAAMLQDKLEKAEKLIGGLSGERVRWEASIKGYDALLTNVPGDALIAAGFLSYAGPFDTAYRAELVATWQQRIKDNAVPVSHDFNFATFLADPSDVRDWVIQGLPSDQFSTENGVIVTRGRRWPLMVDPQGQANKWIREKEKKRGIKVTDLKAKDFLRELEGAITYGLPYLLQDVEEELDPALEPVLTKSIVKKGTREVLRLGDKELDYNPGFRLYVTTKLANPHYTPEVSTKVAIVNFAVKEQGLEAQLLAMVVREEEPMLEQEKSRLVLSVAAGKRKLAELESTILRLLSEVKGSLLDDAEIVGVLQASKTTSEEVTSSLVVAEATEVKIDAAREGYRPVATRASLLYFVLNDLARVDSMYQFSLDAYSLLFLQSIVESREKGLRNKTVAQIFDEEGGGPGAVLLHRIQDINDYHTYEVYKYACRGLFERHKLLLSFQICIRRQQVEAGKGPGINAAVYDWFLKGATVMDRSAQKANPDPKWIAPTMWDAVTDLEAKVEGAFQGLAAAVAGNLEAWAAWYYSPTPEKEPLPGDWEGRLDDLARLALVRAMRVDRVLAACSRYVARNLDQIYCEPPPFDLRQIYDSSSNKTPLVFVLSPGVDPTAELLQLASTLGTPLEYCSLGQGQAPIATRMLNDALKSGGWVFLQNCHLSISWMPTLEKLIDSYCLAAAAGGANAPHKSFRLWLSSSPHPLFPIAILQRGIKLTTEPPKGLKANLVRLYNLLDDAEFDARTAAAPGTYAKLIYALSWYHSLLLERRKFKSLGFCIPYDFNNSDYLLAADILNDYLSSPQAKGVAPPGGGEAVRKTPWDAIRYLIAEVTYGGRVTDDLDRRLVTTYTSQYFCEDAVAKPYAKLSALPDYYIPDDGTVAQYKEHIGKMPQADPPEAFGRA